MTGHLNSDLYDQTSGLSCPEEIRMASRVQQYVTSTFHPFPQAEVLHMKIPPPEDPDTGYKGSGQTPDRLEFYFSMPKDSVPAFRNACRFSGMALSPIPVVRW